MARYAEKTEVSTEASKAEIERTLSRYGATSFMYGWRDKQAVVSFTYRDRTIRLLLTLPDKAADEYKWRRHGAHGRAVRTSEQITAAWEQDCRRSWRALALVIKAKLEAVETGIATFEDEFLAYTMLPGGRTVSEEITPTVARALAAGSVPALLPRFEEAR